MARIKVIEYSTIAKKYNQLVVNTHYSSPAELMNIVVENKGSLFLITAKPLMGKSDLMISMLQERTEIPSVVISLNCTANRLFERMLIANGNKEIQFNSPHYETLISRPILETTKLFFITGRELAVCDITEKLTTLKQLHSIEIVFIDYLQLLQGAHSLVKLKTIATQLQVAIVVLSQLPGYHKNQYDFVPDLDQLGLDDESVSSVDHILYLYRPFYDQITEDEYGNSIINSAYFHWLKGCDSTVKWLMEYSKDTGRFLPGDPIKTLYLQCK